jgi:hypothetical protein
MDLVPGALFVALRKSKGGGPRGAGFRAGEVGFGRGQLRVALNWRGGWYRSVGRETRKRARCCCQSVHEWPNLSLKLTRLSPRLYLVGWAESVAGQRGISGKAAAQLSSAR